MTTIDPTIIGIAQVIASAAVAIALYFTIRTFRQVKNAHQIQLGERLHLDLQDVRKNLIKYFPDDSRDRLNLDDEITFNVLEWNAYLIRQLKIQDKHLIKHFKTEILRWHPVFLRVIPPNQQDRYDQFIKLVEEFKQGVYDDE